MTELLLQNVTEFRGDYPDIQIDQSILAQITEGDPSPFFVTLPIGKVGARSRKMGRSITRRDVELIVSEVNAKRPEGRIAEGHPDPLQRAGKLQQAQWLGALIDGDGMAWGKAYIYPHATAERQVLRTQKAVGAKSGTSVYGGADPSPEGDWARLNLSAIDISTYADAVSQLDNTAVPHITSELNNTENEENEENSMDKEFVNELQESRDDWRDKAKDSETKVAELTTSVAELTQERDALQTTLKALNLGEKPAEAVAELRQQAGVAEAVVKAITENASSFEGLKTDKPAELIAELATAFAKAQVSALDGEITTLIAELVPVEKARPHVADRVALLRKAGDVTDKASAEAQIKAYLETDTYKDYARSLVSEMFGGNVIVGGKPGDDASKHGFVAFEESFKMAKGEQ